MGLTKKDIISIAVIVNALSEGHEVSIDQVMTEEEARRVQDLMVMNNIDEDVEQTILQEELHLLLIKSGVRSSILPEYIN